MATTSDQSHPGMSELIGKRTQINVRWIIFDTACQAKLLALLDCECSIKL